MVATTAKKARLFIEQHRVITMGQSAYDEFVVAINDPDILPAPPLAAKLIEKNAREDGSVDR